MSDTLTDAVIDGLEYLMDQGAATRLVESYVHLCSELKRQNGIYSKAIEEALKDMRAASLTGDIVHVDSALDTLEGAVLEIDNRAERR